MPVKSYKPTSPGIRFRTTADFSEITKVKPEKSLLAPIKKSGGRNNLGRITKRHTGGGHKKAYRIIDFKRDKTGIPGRVESIEYDPNRSCRIALVVYKDGEKRYILAPLNLNVGDTVESGPNADIRPGNAMPLKDIPLGSVIHNIELMPGKGGQLVRSAGNYAQLIAKEGKFAHVRLPSGEVRLVEAKCTATIGQLGNIEHENISIGKAGRSRWLGIRSKVRGVAMNPVDHPHGGGEGKTSGGRHPVTPWGKPTKGYKTVRKKKSDIYILKKRK